MVRKWIELQLVIIDEQKVKFLFTLFYIQKYARKLYLHNISIVDIISSFHFSDVVCMNKHLEMPRFQRAQ